MLDFLSNAAHLYVILEILFSFLARVTTTSRPSFALLLSSDSTARFCTDPSPDRNPNTRTRAEGAHRTHAPTDGERDDCHLQQKHIRKERGHGAFHLQLGRPESGHDRRAVSTGSGVNMNAYRQRDGLFPILVDHLKRASARLHRDLMVEMVVHVWLEHSD